MSTFPFVPCGFLCVSVNDIKIEVCRCNGGKRGVEAQDFLSMVDKLYFFCLYVYATFVPCNNAPKGIKTYVKQCSGSTCLPIKSMNTGGGSFVFHVPQATEMPLLVEAQKWPIYPIYMARI